MFVKCNVDQCVLSCLSFPYDLLTLEFDTVWGQKVGILVIKLLPVTYFLGAEEMHGLWLHLSLQLTYDSLMHVYLYVPEHFYSAW